LLKDIELKHQDSKY